MVPDQVTVPSVPDVGNGRRVQPGRRQPGAKSERAVKSRPGLHLTSRRCRPARVNAVRTAIVLLSYAFLRDNAATFPGPQAMNGRGCSCCHRKSDSSSCPPSSASPASLMIRRRSITTAWLIGGCVIFSALTALSYVNHWLVGSVDFARLVYMYLLPIVVFVIARELRWRPSGLQTVIRFLLGWIFVSAAVSWLQYLYLGYPVGDDITGLNQDAHINATLLLSAACCCWPKGSSCIAGSESSWPSAWAPRRFCRAI